MTSRVSSLYLALGGAAGTLARYWLGGWIQSRADDPFPWGTLGVNLLGSAALGFAARFLLATAVPADLRGLVTIGFLGAFTTFSTFTYETVELLQGRQWGAAGVYLSASVLIGLVGVWVGFGLAAAALSSRG